MVDLTISLVQVKMRVLVAVIQVRILRLRDTLLAKILLLLLERRDLDFDLWLDQDPKPARLRYFRERCISLVPLALLIFVAWSAVVGFSLNCRLDACVVGVLIIFLRHVVVESIAIAAIKVLPIGIDVNINIIVNATATIQEGLHQLILMHFKRYK